MPGDRHPRSGLIPFRRCWDFREAQQGPPPLPKELAANHGGTVNTVVSHRPRGGLRSRLASGRQHPGAVAATHFIRLNSSTNYRRPMSNCPGRPSPGTPTWGW